MVLGDKVNIVLKAAQSSPVLVIGLPASIFGESTIIESKISSKELGIINTAKGLVTPSWFYEIMKGKGSHQIIINNIDLVDKEDQEKFYELLKYKTISNMELPEDCTIIVTGKDVSKISETIIRLCQIVQ